MEPALIQMALNIYFYLAHSTMEKPDKYFDLSKMNQLCKGDSEKQKKYIDQFRSLLSPKCEELEVKLGEKDLSAIRRIIHFMAPQLNFFGRARYSEILVEINQSADIIISERQLTEISEELEQIKKAVNLLDQQTSFQSLK
jgi:HPt (histidine-containing phosphotransfer) domain-containing protein